MADPDFYTRDRPPNASLPEDRPRGGTPGERPARGFKAFWVGGLLLLVLVIVLFVAMVG